MREMTAGHARFAELLEHTPWLTGYWTFDGKDSACDVGRLQEDMGAWSHGEQIMAQFMAAVWFGENRLGLDPIEAASVLDPEFRSIIATWIVEPFWP